MRARHVEIFHAVVQEGSVSAAAKRLRVSQPSVTKLLRQAEEDLGYPLFDRVKGRLLLTEEGRALAREVQRAFAALESVQHLSKRLKQGVQLEFRIAATPALGLQALPDAIALYSEKHPRARFHISTQHSGSLLTALGKAAQGYDLGFTFGAEGARASVANVEVGAARLAAIFPKDLFPDDVDVLTFRDLAGKRLIGLEAEEPLGRVLAEKIREMNISVEVLMRVQTYTLACALAAPGRAVAVVDALTATSFARGRTRGDSRMVAFEPDITLPVTAVYPLETGLPIAARELVDCFRIALAKRNALIESRLAG